MFQEIKNLKEWKELLNQALFKTFFHEPEWEEFLEKEFKWLRFRRFLYKDETLISLAGFKKFGRKYLISHPFCEYGGVVPLKRESNLQNLIGDILKEFGKYKIKIKNHPFLMRISNFSAKGGSALGGQFLISNVGENFNLQTTSSSYWLNFGDKTEQDLFSSFRKTLRHSIKKAEEGGIWIKRCGNSEDLKKFYNIYARVMKRKKTIPYPFSIFEYLYNANLRIDENAANKNSEILLAFYKDKIIAGSVFLHYGKFVHYYLSATDFKFRALCPNYLILWDKIKNSLHGAEQSEANVEVFDFGGTGKGSSLEVFKKGWGAKEMPILLIANHKTSLSKSKIRSIFPLIPTFLLKKLAGRLIKYRI